jgi:O-antigen/teichoic acid export membrane protein
MGYQRMQRLAGYLLSFGLGRGVLFVAPFLLANFLPNADYGLLETALAAASVLASLATLGTTSATPLVLLGHNTAASMKGIITHHLLVVVIALIFLFVGAALHYSNVWLLTALLTAGMTMQSLGSIHLKSKGHGDASVLIDAGLLGLMALAICIAHVTSESAPMTWIWGATLSYSLILVMAYLWILNLMKHTNEPLAWGQTLQLGIPLMMGGLVSFLATTSGRLGMGLMAGPLLTADYAVLARAAALPIVAHQLILIAKFRNLFAQPDAAVARATMHIVLLVGASVIGLIAFSPWLGMLLGPAFVRAFELHRVSCFWIVAQAVLWSAIALNDLVIARHQVMPKVLPYTMSLLGLALFLGWLCLNLTDLTLELFVVVHSAVMLFFYMAQSWIMNRLGLHLYKTWLVTITIFIVLTGAISSID